MDIIYLLRVLLRKKWIILGCTLAALITAWFFSRNLPKKYKSSAQIATGFTMKAPIGLTDQSSGGYYETNLKFDNVITTMTSQQVLTLLSYDLMLHDLSEPDKAFRKLSNNDKDNPVYKSVDKTKARQTFSAKRENMQILSSYNPEDKKLIELMKLYGYDPASLAKKLNIYRLQNTDYINLDSYSSNPLLSAFMVNSICKEFNRFYNTYLSQRSAAGVQLLDSALANQKSALDQKQALLAQAMSGSNTDILGASVEMLNQYQTQLSQQKGSLAAYKLTLENVDKQIALAQKSDGSGIGTNDEIITLKKNMDNLYAQYVDGGSKDESLMNRINALRKEYIAKSSGTTATGAVTVPLSELVKQKSDLDLKIQLAEQQIRSLQSSVNNLSSNVRSSASQSATVSAIQKEVDIAAQDYASIRDKMNLALNSNLAGSDFKQILMGQPALHPEPSKQMVICLLAGLSVFFLTGFIFIFLEYIDTSLKTPSQFSRLISIKLLSAVNNIDLKNHSLIKLISSEAKPDEKRENTFRELLRKIRYEIETSGHKIFLFTSTQSQVGKTTLVQALAYSLSLSKKKILILDTNFCNNDLTLQLKADPNLEAFSVNGEGFSNQKVKSITSNTEIPNVDVIGCKGGDYTPSEILPKNNLLNYLPELTKEYDYLFFEGAPLNEYADSKELMAYADGVIAIFSAESTINENDKESIAFLKKWESKLTGAILNKVDIHNLEI